MDIEKEAQQEIDSGAPGVSTMIMMLMSIKRYRAEREQFLAQPPKMFVKFDANGEFVTCRLNKPGMVFDCDASYVPYWDQAVPAQQEEDDSFPFIPWSKEGEFLQPSPAVAVPKFKGWYCAQCQCGVDPSEVTYHETHTVCGRYITDDEPPTSTRITEQDARDTERLDFVIQK